MTTAQLPSLRRAMWVAALTLVATAVGVLLSIALLSNSMRESADRNTSDLIVEQKAADQIVISAFAQQAAAYRYVGNPGPDVIADFRARGAEAYAGIREYLGLTMPLTSRIKVESIKEAHQQFEVSAQRVFDLTISGEPEETGRRMAQLAADTRRLESAVHAFIRERTQQRQLQRDRQLAALRRLHWAELLIAFALAAVGLVLAVILRRQIVAPFVDLNAAATALAAGGGKHEVRVAPQHYREFQDVADSFDHMAATVRAARAEVEARGADATRAAAELRDALSLLTATLEATADGIMVVNQDGRVVLYNRQFVELWGIPKDVLATLDDKRMLDFVTAQLSQPEAFRRRVDELYATPDAESTDILTFTDGRVVERVSRPQRVSGRNVGRVWCFRDVTAQRTLEQQMQQAQKIEAVGTLAGGLAHDFNNLLQVIRLHAQFVEDQLPAGSEARADVVEVVRASDRAASLTRQLLAFSRQQVLVPEVLDLGVAIGSLEAVLRRLAGEHIVVSTVGTHIGAHVEVDRGQLEQVVINLVANARDSMPRGGRLVIEVSEEDAPASAASAFSADDGRSGRFAVLTVSDTGCGIPPAIIDRIFEPFFTTKPVGKGSGLGLATAYGIVKQSGGHVTVESVEGAGSTFRVYLPLVRAASGRAIPAATDTAGVAPATRPAGETILLVEDEAAVRALSRRVLERHGYTVYTARHGADALRVAAELPKPIDLLLTDVVMPEMGGADLVRRLRERQPDVAVVFMSGYTAQEIGSDALSALGARFLQKPFDSAALAETVRHALDARHSLV